ncbi:protein SKIP34 [Rutidosis leptorrhynchoides]|uniref:protein SKIP34 n=1 Tax=Rutidosis leptorrhynchoides TaxID=125765 RepID=UPI003A9915E5
MCCGGQRLPPSGDDYTSPNAGRSPPRRDLNTAVVEGLRLRLAETEARLQGGRAREAELSKKLIEMKRFVSVMEIIKLYLERRFQAQQHQLTLLISHSSVHK